MRVWGLMLAPMTLQEINPTTAHPLQVLRFDDLQKLNIFRNRVTLRRWIEAGHFPAPIRLGPNSVGWRARDVQEWLDRRSAASQNGPEEV